MCKLRDYWVDELKQKLSEIEKWKPWAMFQKDCDDFSQVKFLTSEEAAKILLRSKYTAAEDLYVVEFNDADYYLVKFRKDKVSPFRHWKNLQAEEYAASSERDYDVYEYKSKLAFVYFGMRYVFPKYQLLYFYTEVLPDLIANKMPSEVRASGIINKVRLIQKFIQKELLKYALNFPFDELSGSTIQKTEKAAAFVEEVREKLISKAIEELGLPEDWEVVKLFDKNCWDEVVRILLEKVTG